MKWLAQIPVAVYKQACVAQVAFKVFFDLHWKDLWITMWTMTSVLTTEKEYT